MCIFVLGVSSARLSVVDSFPYALRKKSRTKGAFAVLQACAHPHLS